MLARDFNADVVTANFLAWVKQHTDRPDLFFKTVENKIVLNASNEICLRLAEVHLNVGHGGLDTNDNPETWACVQELLRKPVTCMGKSQMELNLDNVLKQRAKFWNNDEMAAAVRPFAFAQLHQLFSSAYMWKTTKPYYEICDNAVALSFGLCGH